MFTNIKKKFNSRIGKNSLLSILDQMLSMGMNLLLAILFGRYLGAESLGQYSLGVAIVGVLAIFSNFGIVSVMSREIAKSPLKLTLYLGNALGIKFFISFPVLVVSTVCTVYLLDYKFETCWIVVWIAIYNTMLSSISYIGTAFVALHRNDLLLKMNIVNKSASLLSSFILLSMNFGLSEVLYSYSGICVVVFIYALYQVRKLAVNFSIRLNLRFCKPYIVVAFPLVLASAAEFINLKIDTVFIGSLINEERVGIYSAAYNLFLAMTLIPLALTKVYFPNFIDYYQKNKSGAFALHKRYLMLFVVYSIIVGGSMYMVAPWVIDFLYGGKFIDSIEILQYLSGILFVIVLNRLYNYTLVALKQNKYYFKITFIGMLFNLTLNYVLILNYSLLGAVMATFITEFIILCLSVWKVETLKNV